MFTTGSLNQSCSFACEFFVADSDYFEGFKLRDKAATETVLGWIREAVSRLHWTNSLSREDLVSQVSLKLYEIVSRPHQPRIISPKGLIHHVVKCVAVDVLRYDRRAKEFKEKLKLRPPPNPNPEEILLSDEEIKLFYRVRAGSDKPCRELWELMFIEGLGYKEMAERLHISEGALRVRHTRCKEKAVEWIKKNT